MTDFGGRLRQARERRGISLRQIATSTKISVGALEALERNDISKLPGGIFSRAFVRAYAIEVGLDAEQTVRDFLENFQHEGISAGSPHVPEAPADESSFESQQTMARVLLWLVVISVIAALPIVYFTMGSRAATSTSQGSPSSSTQTPAGGTSVPAPADASVSPALGTSPATRTISLEIRPTGRCWVSLSVDGQSVLRRELERGERHVRQISREAVIEIGDAGAFEFSLNGRPARPVGESGQVRTVRITPQNYTTFLR